MDWASKVTARSGFVATIGFSIGLDMTVFRSAAAVLLILVGTVLLLPRLQTQFAMAAGPVSNWTQNRFSGFSTGVSSQFGVGMLLGAVWTPCVGPTLGAASIMAARGENLGMVVLTMLAFGIGTSLPLLALALMSREALLRWRGRMLGASSSIKMALGALLVVAGAMTLSGFDRTIQIGLERALPDWLVAITTSL